MAAGPPCLLPLKFLPFSFTQSQTPLSSFPFPSFSDPSLVFRFRQQFPDSMTHLSRLSDRELDEKLQRTLTSVERSCVDERERRIRAEYNKEISILGGILLAFKEKIPTDIQLRPGKNNGPCIPAHRDILATRSKIFKQMLEFEPTADHTITIQEMNSEELESLLEFFYTGSLAQDKMKNNLISLCHAAHKYEITSLQEFCERYILDSLNASNVLDAMEISDVFSSQALMDAALEFVIEKMEGITVSPRYELFAAKNPDLSVQITRAFAEKAKRNEPREPDYHSSAVYWEYG